MSKFQEQKNSISSYINKEIENFRLENIKNSGKTDFDNLIKKLAEKQISKKQIIIELNKFINYNNIKYEKKEKKLNEDISECLSFLGVSTVASVALVLVALILLILTIQFWLTGIILVPIVLFCKPVIGSMVNCYREIFNTKKELKNIKGIKRFSSFLKKELRRLSDGELDMYFNDKILKETKEKNTERKLDETRVIEKNIEFRNASLEKKGKIPNYEGLGVVKLSETKPKQKIYTRKLNKY